MAPPPTLLAQKHDAENAAHLGVNEVKFSSDDSRRRSHIPTPIGHPIATSARPISVPQPCLSPLAWMNKKGAIPPHMAQSTKIPSPKRQPSLLYRPRCSLQSPPQHPQQHLQQQYLSTCTDNSSITDVFTQRKTTSVAALARSSTMQSELSKSPSNMSLFVFDDTAAPAGLSTPRGSLLGFGGSGSSGAGNVSQSIKYIPSRASSQILPLPSFSHGTGLYYSPAKTAAAPATRGIASIAAAVDTTTSSTTDLSQQKSSTLNSATALDARAMTIRPVVSNGDNNKRLFADKKSSSSSSSFSLLGSSRHATADFEADKENNPPAAGPEHVIIASTGVRPVDMGIDPCAEHGISRPRDRWQPSWRRRARADMNLAMATTDIQSIRVRPPSPPVRPTAPF